MYLEPMMGDRNIMYFPYIFTAYVLVLIRVFAEKFFGSDQGVCGEVWLG